MESSGAELERAYAYYGVLSRNQSSPEFRVVQKKLAPNFADYRSKIIQNEKLFKRIATIYENAKKDPLEADQQRLLEWTYQTYEMSGAGLDKEKKHRYAEINKELSQLYTLFSDNVLHDEENYITFLTVDQLGGLLKILSNLRLRWQKIRVKRANMPSSIPVPLWTHFLLFLQSAY